MTDQMSIVPVENRISISRPTMLSMTEVQTVHEICKIAARSGFLSTNAPRNDMIQREADAFFVGMYGMELGVPVITALRQIFVIEGKPACSAALLVSLLRRAGCVVEMPDPGTVTEETGATVYITRPGGKRNGYTYTKKMAEDAGLWMNKPNWKKSWREMLIWRAASTGSRMEGGDITNGLYTVEELSPDTEVDETGSPIQISHPTPADDHLESTPGDIIDPPVETKKKAIAWASQETVKALVDKAVATFGVTEADILRYAGIKTISDYAAWNKLYPDRTEAGNAIKGAYHAEIENIAKAPPATPKKDVEDLLPKLDEKGLEALRQHLAEDYWMLTEDEALERFFEDGQVSHWSDFKNLDDAKNAIRAKAIEFNESVVAYKARFNHTYTTFYTAVGEIRCYGRDQIKALGPEWAVYAESWQKGKVYVFADAKLPPVAIHWNTGGDGDKKYMLADKEGGLMIFEGKTIPF